MLVVCIGFNFTMMKLFPTIMSQYNNTSLYRSMDDPISMLFVIHPFLVGLILAFIWDKTKSLFTAKKFLSRGVQFGLIYFLTVIPGLFISYVTSPYSVEITFSWLISVLLIALTAGVVLENANN